MRVQKLLSKMEKEFVMEKILKASVRTESGKGVAKRLRREGKIPAVAYDRTGKSTLLVLNQADFVKLNKDVTESTIVTVDADGKDFEAFIKHIDFDILSGLPKHVDFYQVERGKVLRAKVSVVITGNPVGVREGGVLETGITEIDVECLPKDLPPVIKVDVTNLGANQAIHVRDLDVSKDVKVHTPDDSVIAVVKFIRSDVPETPAEATGAAPAEA